jgi:hypothetical protein
MKDLIVILALILVGLRLFWCPHVAPSLVGSYEALAHVFMGFLIAFAIAKRSWWYFWAFLIPTIVEGVAFFALP